MTQSMFVILPLMVLSLYVYHQRRTTIQMQETMVQSAVEVIGNGIAVERLRPGHERYLRRRAGQAHRASLLRPEPGHGQ